MASSGLAVIVLVVLATALIVVAARLRGRLHLGEDFILGRRRLGARLGGVGLAMNGVPIWWLLYIAVTAYATGRSAFWPALALLSGVFVVGWHLAPRLRALSAMQRCGTISEVLIGDAGEKMRALLVRSALAIIVFTLLFAAVIQLQFAAQFLRDSFALTSVTAIAFVGFVPGFALLLAGFWSATVADALQAVLWLAVCSVVLVALVIALEFSPEVRSTVPPSDWFAGQSGLLTVSFMTGVGFIAGDAAGQTTILTRCMACTDDASLGRTRNYAILWAAATLACALAVGWGFRALNPTDAPSVAIFAELLARILSPNVAGFLILLLFAAGSVAIGNAMLATTAHAANDLRQSGTIVSVAYCRIVLVVAVAFTVAVAIYLPPTPPQKGFDRLLFCWHAAGAAFGPLLIVRLSGKRVRPGSTLGSMWSGFLLTVVFYLMPDTPGELLERGLPFTAALGIALSGGERRRNPDRADRGERTVHDRLPI